ncbi:MAG: hypothetical protein JWP66_808 [Naasia sp.]|nr:hypothetical protein [Naasia sp.]
MLLGAFMLAVAATTAVAPADASPPLGSAPAICAPLVFGEDPRTGAPTVDIALAGSLEPSQLLRDLDDLEPDALRTLVDDNPVLVRQFLERSPSPTAVAAWWEERGIPERRELVDAAPTLVGNLDGVPYEMRDAANRLTLDRALDRLRVDLADAPGKGAATDLATRVGMLEKVEASLTETPGGPDRTLLLLDTSMPGRAAVVLGDLDTADYVSVLVPGALLSIREHMTEWTKVTADLYDAQGEWLAMFEEDATVATVSWIGYRTPDVTNVVGLDLAEEGATFLSGTVNGLRDGRPGDEPYISVFAHSYGATAAMLALSRGDMELDALAMMGSPGGSADSVDDLAVPKRRVWVGEAAWDPVVQTAFFGVDPGSEDFGARTMSVAGAVDPLTGVALTASVGHDWYLEPGTESLRNLSLIGIDRGDWVTEGGADDAGKTLALGR